MSLTLVCECGNNVHFFETGETEEYNVALLEAEDDDVVQVALRVDGMLLRCRFCQRGYKILPTL
ncbi:hypothetical protein [Paenibacillus beijingensis]|uniref:Uncharacterized protein n=1 Tax=Paenibacillus beijingensis TaxID=1126833 RepID=A0A0D5NP54_9BACL|nr:hypothetical protein [Paenibacillus beijingensis]AJY77104.1 hypothetical protein VN24_24335 [Paenibacillus beijingensis]